MTSCPEGRGWEPGYRRHRPDQYWSAIEWTPPGSVRPDPDVRIGDVERDRAVSDLADHFAAGRLTREEFDERSDQAIRARRHVDLAPLFADLPTRAGLEPAARHSAPQSRPRGWMLGPVLLLGLMITGIAAVTHAPWVIWALLSVFLVSGLFRGGRSRRRIGPPIQGMR